MGRIWGEEAKYTAWLRVELAVCEAYARRGRIPADALARVRQKSRVDVRRILEIQDRVKHEMIALLTSLEEQLGTDSRFVHIGLTANDVWDTALAVQLRDAADLLIAGQERLRAALGDLARRHKDTLIVGRTHGVGGADEGEEVGVADGEECLALLGGELPVVERALEDALPSA